ncbi:MAG: hypothetical protein LUD73_04555 [Lachnospiraceae bacterium]|nr:hypothetical protein [Lachnospiraceae bacterium]
MSWEEEMKFRLQWLLEEDVLYHESLKENDLQGALAAAGGVFKSFSPELTEILDELYQCAVRIDEQRY